MNIHYPCLVFVGDAEERKQVKTAFGLKEWRPERCVGQYRMTDTTIDLGLCDMTIAEGIEAGAKTFLIGVSPYERELPDRYREIVLEAIRSGLHVASGLHDKLADDPEIASCAEEHGVNIYDFRHRPQNYPKGNGLPRTGLRLLTIGDDCACGKKFTALSIHRALIGRKVKSSFRATGQTGFLIADSGINNDTIPADFLSGAAEWLSPDNDPDHWDVIEGQGSIWHPSFAGGALSLLMGSQPDLIVLCHEPGRQNQRGVTLPPVALESEISMSLAAARRTNIMVKLGALSVYGANMEQGERLRYMEHLSNRFDVPVFDPAVGGPAFDRFIGQMQNCSEAKALENRFASGDPYGR